MKMTKKSTTSSNILGISFTPTHTPEGNTIYPAWPIIKEIRGHERWRKIVFQIREVMTPDPISAIAIIDMKINGEVVASAAASQSKEDLLADGTPIGSSYIASAVTKAKGLAAQDFFGLVNEYKEEGNSSIDEAVGVAINNLISKL